MSSNNWTREHDRILAEKCENRRTTIIYPDGVVIVNDDGTFSPMDAYNTDPAAEKRAAEAWRLQKPGRSYEIRSAVNDWFGCRPASTACFSRPAQIAGTGEHLHEAIYEAVKDEELEKRK